MPDLHPDKTPEQVEQMFQALATPSYPESTAAPDAATPPAEAPAEAPPPAPVTAKPSDEPPTEEPPAQAATPEAAPDMAEVLSRLEEESLKRQKLELRLQAEAELRNLQTTRTGYYKRALVDVARTSETPIEPPDPYAEENITPNEVQRLRAEMQSLRVDAVERSKIDALNRFMAAYPDAAEVAVEMKPFAEQASRQYQAWFDSGDPGIIGRTAELVFKEAYLEAKAHRHQAKRAEAVERRAQQFEATAKSKKSAAISGSGGASTPPSTKKDIKDLSADEAAAALDRMARG